MCDIICNVIVYNLCQFTVTAQEGPGIIIAHPGQNVELLCNLTLSRSETAAWLIDHGRVYTVQQLHNGIVTGYSSNGTNLIIEDIMMNDDRNDTEYGCVTVSSTVSNPTVGDIEDKSDPTILYVGGEYQHTYVATLMLTIGYSIQLYSYGISIHCDTVINIMKNFLKFD